MIYWPTSNDCSIRQFVDQFGMLVSKSWQNYPGKRPCQGRLDFDSSRGLSIIEQQPLLDIKYKHSNILLRVSNKQTFPSESDSKDFHRPHLPILQTLPDKTITASITSRKAIPPTTYRSHNSPPPILKARFSSSDIPSTCTDKYPLSHKG
jgi:hypothetical protein